jgi:hypothetical protein
MSSTAGRSGAFLMSWSQTEVDGHAEAPEADIRTNAYWRWSGEAVDISAAVRLAERETFSSDTAFRNHAAAAARAVIGQATDKLVEASASPAGRPDRSFRLSDGRETWMATMISISGLEHPLLLFADGVPPAGLPLRIEWVETFGITKGVGRASGVFGLTSGTWIETPGGSRQIEHLSAGDKVLTLDAGVQELIWIGARTLSIGELWRAPELAPVKLCQGALDRFRADEPLVVSPYQRLLMRGRHAGAEEVTEALVAARDLVDGDAILREALHRPVTYFLLLLEQHHVIMANGFETEAFHPSAAPLHALPEAERQRLFDVMPVLNVEPAAYGPLVRPVLSRAEVALLAAA